MTPSLSPSARLRCRLPGRSWSTMMADEVCSIGSDPGCTVQVSDAGLDARHAILQWGDEGLEVMDLFSASGTHLGGRSIEAAPLGVGDEVRCGELVISVEAVHASTAQPVASSPAAAAQAAASATERGLWVSELSPQQERPPPAAPFSGEAAQVTPPPLASTPPPPPLESAWDALRERAEHDRPSGSPADSARGAASAESLRVRLAAAWTAFLERRTAARLHRLAVRQAKAEAREQPSGAASAQVTSAATGPSRFDAAWAASGAQVADATDPLEALPAEERPRRSFAEDFSEALQRSAGVVGSVGFHALLAVLLSLFQTAPKPVEPPPREVLSALARAPDVREEVIPEPEAPEAPDDEPDFEAEAELDAFEPALEESALDELAAEFPDEGLPTAEDSVTDEAFAPHIGLSGLFGTPSGGPSGGGDLGIPEETNRGYARHVGDLRRSGLDVVLVMDTTSSMAPVIERTRADMTRIIRSLSSLVPGHRLGVVAYRDEGDRYVTLGQALGPYTFEAVGFLGDLDTAGGGDHPEGVLQGVSHAIGGMGWRRSATQVLIVIGDAPGHSEDRKRLHRMARRFAKGGGRIHTVAVATRAGASLPEESFSALARAGQGTYIPLDDASNVEELVPLLLELTIGPEHAAAIRASVRGLEGRETLRVLRRQLRSSSTAAWSEQLRRPRPDPRLLSLIAEEAERRHLPALLSAWSDDEVPLAARFALRIAIERIAGLGRHALSAAATERLLEPRATAEQRARQARSVSKPARRR